MEIDQIKIFFVFSISLLPDIIKVGAEFIEKFAWISKIVNVCISLFYAGFILRVHLSIKEIKVVLYMNINALFDRRMKDKVNNI